jgi:hypothetical protein
MRIVVHFPDLEAYLEPSEVWAKALARLAEEAEYLGTSSAL